MNTVLLHASQAQEWSCDEDGENFLFPSCSFGIA